MSDENDISSFSDNLDNKLLEEYKRLQNENEQLDKEIQRLQDPNNKNMVDKQKYMKLLHEYNDIKDAAQIVMGALANIKEVTVTELHKQYNLPAGKDADL